LQHRRDSQEPYALLGHHPVIPIPLQIEVQLQRRRLRLRIAAISLATLRCPTVATLVMVLFVGVVSWRDLSPLVAILFILAMGLRMAAVPMLVLEIRLGSCIASNI
jgi:hypothetical protein